MGKIGDISDMIILAGLGYLAYKVVTVSSKPGAAATLIPSIPIQGLAYITKLLDERPYHPWYGGGSDARDY